jgi:signal transduction histidine kinase/CheY-like chemotaxis protein
MTFDAVSANNLTAGLDQATAGIALWDERQTLAFANRHFLYAFDLDPERAVGLAFPDFLRGVIASGELVLPGSDGDWIAAALADFGREKSWEQPMADGRTLALEQRPFGDGGMTITLHDISGLKSVEFDLRRARDAAETSDEAKSRFLRAANHDLRQPLATLKILIYNCLGETDEEHRKDLLHTMDISVSIMEDLLGALLQIGQLDAGQIAARITTFQLSQIFDRLRIQFAHQAAEKGLKLKFVGMRYTVTSDKALLERIVTNLVANAIRYTDVGKIVVGCKPSGRHLRVGIWDSGRGIAPEYLPHIFEEFYQVANSRRAKRPGLGLGLNIVKRLANLLGHEIGVRSTLGQGSVFSVTVPVGNVWHSEHEEIEVTEMNGGEFAGKTVLLIEDDTVLQQTTTELLERWGIVVLAATNQSEAQSLLREAATVPALIIADYSLRGEFGTKVVLALRKEFGASIPALIVTADIEPHIIEEISKEAIPVLIKPVSPPRLRVMMHNLLFEGHATAGPAISKA